MDDIQQLKYLLKPLEINDRNRRYWWMIAATAIMTVISILGTHTLSAKDVSVNLNLDATPSPTDQSIRKHIKNQPKQSPYGLNVQLKGFRSQDIALKEHAGKVVALHFWATWCAPCLTEMPEITRFVANQYPALAKRGLVLLSISNDLRERDLDRYLTNNITKTPVYLDTFGELNDRLQLAGLPSTVILGRRGETLATLHGTQDWESAEFKMFLERFLD